MKYCSFLLGNTSSGIKEAASFGKYVINLGNRQEGRKRSQNIYNLPFNKELIMQSIAELENKSAFFGENIYCKGNAALTICSILKSSICKAINFKI